MTGSEIVRLLLQGGFIGVALAAPVGPINIEIVRRGLHGGFLSGWLVGLGALTIDTIYATLVVSGATPLADSARLRVPLFFAGAIALIWLGQRSLRAALDQPMVVASGVDPRGGYLMGFMMGALNPFGIIYWLSVGAALAAAAVAQVGAIGSPLLVGGVFGGVLLWITFFSGFVHLGRRFMTPRTLGISNITSGIVLIGFGLYFAALGLRDLYATL